MRLLLLAAMSASLALSQSPDTRMDVLRHYLNVSRDMPAVEDGEAMQIDIEASLPRLQKRGTMRGIRVITRAGQTVYTSLRFSGDKLIGRDVISRYLAADAGKPVSPGDVSIAPENYRFQPAGEARYNDRVAQVFRLTPKHKKPGLFRGEVWLDKETARPLREMGEFVKSPSHFLSHPRFVRDYDAGEDRGRPRRLILTAHASFIGDVEMTVWFGGSACAESAEEDSTPVDFTSFSNP